MSLLVVVAAALIDQQGRVLIAQRPLGKEFSGMWEFPGGKVELGESPEAALVRELREELGIAIDPSALTPVVFSSGSRGARHLLLLLYRCAKWVGEVQALDAMALKWVKPAEIRTNEMPPADRPLVSILAAQG